MSNLVWNRVKLVSNIQATLVEVQLQCAYLFIPTFLLPFDPLSLSCNFVLANNMRIQEEEEEASYLSDEQSSNLIQINDQYEKCSLFVSRAFFGRRPRYNLSPSELPLLLLLPLLIRMLNK